MIDKTNEDSRNHLQSWVGHLSVYFTVYTTSYKTITFLFLDAVGLSFLYLELSLVSPNARQDDHTFRAA